MTQPTSSDLNAYTPVLSATNFDLPSLHLLRSEIDVALKDAETHLSEFNDDSDQAPLLLDSVEVLSQLADVLKLISLQGGSDLAEAIAHCLKQLYDAGDNNDSALIMDISEAIMTLDRYIEFVLLKETLEPTLLLPIINKLYEHLGKPALDMQTFAELNTTSVSIANPEQNFQSLASLNLNTDMLSKAYRSGLGVILTHQEGPFSSDEEQKLEAMSAACQLIAGHSDSLFWQAASAVVTDIASVLPLNNARKRTLIFLEQQFHDYLPVADNRFADLVSFACQRDHDLARQIQQKYAVNRLDDNQRDQMKRFLFGPNRKVTDTLNELIQNQINTIKEKVDNFARVDEFNPTITDAAQIADDLLALGSAMKLLGLNDATEALHQESEAVRKWQTPTPQDFDQLLTAMMVAENASIFMAKSHTPGAVNLPLNNRKISLHQLDTAYDTLITESRSTIANIERAITEYITDPQRDKMHILNLPAMMQQVAGAIRFLQLRDAASMLSRLSTYTDERVLTSDTPVDDATLANIADVVMAVDYHLEGFERNHPVGKQAMIIGQHSLSQLLAA
ncbi:MAG: hypothetical protein Q4P13_10335 [Psychrobacter sp.]|nr:hypothetical protein [Psychrobacter sp.]